VTKIIFRKAELDFLLNSPSGTVGRYLARKGSIIKAAAKRQVGVRTGALRRSISTRHRRNSRGQFVLVGSSLDYALAHHQGTKPHIITPNRSQVLRFVRGSTVIYATSVRHPGTRPNRYLTNNLKLVK
jgi:hypothetical protein